MKNKLINFLLKIKNKYLIVLADKVIYRMSAHRVTASSAQLAYFTLLSLFPFLVLLLNVLSRQSIVKPEAVNTFINLFPHEARAVIGSFVKDIKSDFGSNTQLAVSFFGGLYSASLGVYPTIVACNRAYESDDKRTYPQMLLMSLFFTFMFLCMLMVLLLSRIVGDRFAEKIFDYFKVPSFVPVLWAYIKYLIIPLFGFFIFYLLNRFSLPKAFRKKLVFGEIWPGALFSTISMIASSKIFSFQASHSGKYVSTYGSISGIIIMICWMYLMGTMLVLGFEINGAIMDMRLNGRNWPRRESVLKDVLSLLGHKEPKNETEECIEKCRREKI